MDAEVGGKKKFGPEYQRAWRASHPENRRAISQRQTAKRALTNKMGCLCLAYGFETPEQLDEFLGEIARQQHSAASVRAFEAGSA